MALRGKLETYNKQCGSVPQVCCPHCGQYTTFMKIQRKSKFRVLLLPLFVVTHQAYLVCGACGRVYPVSKKGFGQITPAADVQEAIRMQEQTAAQEKEQYRSAGFSAKNQTVAVVLSALLMLYGAPFFYIGKPLWGILCLLVSILSTVLGLFPLMFLIVLGGMVFAILIGAGKVKDKDGKYIVSEKQKQSLLHGER